MHTGCCSYLPHYLPYLQATGKRTVFDEEGTSLDPLALLATSEFAEGDDDGDDDGNR